MKSVLISIQPQWCELIASGKKTIEVRKSAPKEVPFKVYIYQTKKRITLRKFKEDYSNGIIHNAKLLKAHGKVIGEFICDKVYKIEPDGEYYTYGYDIDDDSLEETCLTREDLTAYGKSKPLYGWHISDLKIYDKPKELSEFGKKIDRFKRYSSELGMCSYECGECEYFDYPDNPIYEAGECCADRLNDGVCPLIRPPQSWCFCQEVKYDTV